MSDPKRYDDVIGMLTDQCHQYALEVERLKAMPHDDDTCPHLVVLGRLEAENARLKAQIDAKMEVGVPYADYERLFAENARLKAEVEELKAQPDPLTAYLYAAELAKDDIKRLKAEVERLTKAGDAMADWFFDSDSLVKEWNAAKEGKPRA